MVADLIVRENYINRSISSYGNFLVSSRLLWLPSHKNINYATAIVDLHRCRWQHSTDIVNFPSISVLLKYRKHLLGYKILQEKDAR